MMTTVSTSVLSVFAGPDEQHRAHTGVLVFRPQEWADFSDRLAGPGHTVLPALEGARR